ncbi:MAG: hypothetical protein U1E43_10370 [Rhodospirillales bacterium]
MLFWAIRSSARILNGAFAGQCRALADQVGAEILSSLELLRPVQHTALMLPSL